MKLYAIVILVLAVLAFAGWGGHALYASGHDDGYNKRVSEEAATYAAAEDNGRKAQSDADQQTIGDLRHALADETKAASAHDQQLADLRNSASSLQRRLHDLETQSPDAARWLAEPVPDAVLASVCWAATDPGATAGCDGH